MQKFKKAVIGHSDHTSNIFTSIAAVLGARFVEKHICASEILVQIKMSQLT